MQLSCKVCDIIGTKQIKYYPHPHYLICLLLIAMPLTKQPKLTAIIQSRRLTVFGHIMRMDDNADAKRILLASPPADWRRQLGRPRITWRSTVQLDLRQHHLTEAADLAQNRRLLRMMSTYGATQSWVACQKRRRRHCHPLHVISLFVSLYPSYYHYYAELHPNLCLNIYVSEPSHEMWLTICAQLAFFSRMKANMTNCKFCTILTNYYTGSIQLHNCKPLYKTRVFSFSSLPCSFTKDHYHGLCSIHISAAKVHVCLPTVPSFPTDSFAIKTKYWSVYNIFNMNFCNAWL